MSEKNLNYYLKLPYTFVLRNDDEGDVVARVDQLPGCVTHGENPIEALTNLREVMEVWIKDQIESGQPVPEPSPEEPLPSGKWLQRVPRSLHKKLSQWAKAEGVSLNQLVTSVLAEALGSKPEKQIEQDTWPVSRFFGNSSLAEESTWQLPRNPSRLWNSSRHHYAVFLNCLAAKPKSMSKSRHAEMVSHVDED